SALCGKDSTPPRAWQILLSAGPPGPAPAPFPPQPLCAEYSRRWRWRGRSQGLLNLQRENVGNAAQDLALLLVGHAGQRVAFLQAFRIVEAQVQFLLQRVGVLVAADADVARKQRHPAANDID